MRRVGLRFVGDSDNLWTTSPQRVPGPLGPPCYCRIHIHHALVACSLLGDSHHPKVPGFLLSRGMSLTETGSRMEGAQMFAVETRTGGLNGSALPGFESREPKLTPVTFSVTVL